MLKVEGLKPKPYFKVYKGVLKLNPYDVLTHQFY